MRALIVDDLPGIRSLLGRLLEEQGFEVAEAGDGVAALELIAREAPFDLIVVDWKMPRMNGFQLVCELRANPANDGLPILVLSSEMDVFKVSRVLDAGASEYLLKPFSRQTLFQKLAHLGLRRRRITASGRYTLHP